MLTLMDWEVAELNYILKKELVGSKLNQNLWAIYAGNMECEGIIPGSW